MEWKGDDMKMKEGVGESKMVKRTFNVFLANLCIPAIYPSKIDSQSTVPRRPPASFHDSTQSDPATEVHPHADHPHQPSSPPRGHQPNTSR